MKVLYTVKYDEKAKKAVRIPEEKENKKVLSTKKKKAAQLRRIEKLLKQRVTTRRVIKPAKQLVVTMEGQQDDTPSYFKEELDTAKKEMFFK